MALGRGPARSLPQADATSSLGAWSQGLAGAGAEGRRTALGTGVSGAIIAASLRAGGDYGPGLAGAFAAAIAVGIGGLALTGRLRSVATRRAPAAVPSVAETT